jgi:hypothetical protein
VTAEGVKVILTHAALESSTPYTVTESTTSVSGGNQPKIDISFQFSESRVDRWPDLGADEFLAVGAEIEGGEDILDSWEGKVTVTDEQGRVSVPVRTTYGSGKITYGSGMVDSDPQESVEWICVVSATSRSFTLHLPGEVAVELPRAPDQ